MNVSGADCGARRGGSISAEHLRPDWRSSEEIDVDEAGQMLRCFGMPVLASWKLALIQVSTRKGGGPVGWTLRRGWAGGNGQASADRQKDGCLAKMHAWVLGWISGTFLLCG